MGKKIWMRIVSSFFSLLALIVIVFLLSRLTGDPAALFLPIEVVLEAFTWTLQLALITIVLVTIAASVQAACLTVLFR